MSKLGKRLIQAAREGRAIVRAAHPGKYLAEILSELSISQAQFARATGVSPRRVSLLIKGARPMTAELALLFGKALGQTPECWLNLQTAYDADHARKADLQAMRARRQQNSSAKRASQ